MHVLSSGNKFRENYEVILVRIAEQSIMLMHVLNMGSKSLHENCEAQGIVVVRKAHYEVTER